MHHVFHRAAQLSLACALLAGCGSISTDVGPTATPLDPAVAPKAVIDRFSSNAGVLFVRTSTRDFPTPNSPIDMDREPFITSGFGPNGEHIKYYNFDVQRTAPAPLYVLVREGEASPVLGQLNIVDVIPGQDGYNDFWRIMKVTVPRSYVANTITSFEEIRMRGLSIEATSSLVNCPIVPEGSIARLGGGARGLTHGWYRKQLVAYFNFDEAGITTTPQGLVPLAPIFVSFTANPGQPGGGSEFKTEPASVQTHNVAGTLPGQTDYTPFWVVIPFDNSAFATVHNLATAVAAPRFSAVGNVNCPIVEVRP